VPLAAYLPLENVYAFHETAENWILRRYVPAVTSAAGAERRRAAWGESVVAVFPERQPRRTLQVDGGQQAPEQRTVYLRTRLRLTDTTSTQPTDVLFDPNGCAWQATEDGRWDEARGYAVTLTRAGRRGMPPWT
jgi:hypothetical protein